MCPRTSPCGWGRPARCSSKRGRRTSRAIAQETTDDNGGREYFERGRFAFEEADYETALAYFRHAYELSRRAELQYNIGVAADRLQREEEALEAFERYLAETEKPTRAAEVRQRIDALERSIAEREVTELALEEAAWIDGASMWQGFRRIILPISLPALAVVALTGPSLEMVMVIVIVPTSSFVGRPLN